MNLTNVHVLNGCLPISRPDLGQGQRHDVCPLPSLANTGQWRRPLIGLIVASHFLEACNWLDWLVLLNEAYPLVETPSQWRQGIYKGPLSQLESRFQKCQSSTHQLPELKPSSQQSTLQLETVIKTNCLSLLSDKFILFIFGD